MRSTNEHQRVIVRAVEPKSTTAVRVGDVFATEYDTRDALESFAKTLPEAAIDVVVDTIPPYASDPRVLLLRIGRVRWAQFDWSEEPDTLKYPQADRAPEIPLDIDDEKHGAVIAAFDRAAVPRQYWSLENEYGAEDEVLLPYAYETMEGALEAFVALGQSGALFRDEFAVHVQIARCRYSVWFDATGVEVRPLYPWLDEPALRTLLRSTLPAPSPARARRFDGREIVESKDASPLTCGSIVRRKKAAWALSTTTTSNGAVFNTEWKREPAVVAALLDAIRSPENAGHEYDELRIDLYEMVGKCSAEPREIVRLLIEALGCETEIVKKKLYVMLSTFEDDDASRALVSGFKYERGDVRRGITLVLWRRVRAIEMLVRDELVPSWDRDAKWSQRILRLLAEEYVPVERAWLGGASPELVAALGSHVRDGA